MKTIQLNKKNIFFGNLILVNLDNPINDHFFSIEHDLLPLNLKSDVFLTTQTNLYFNKLLSKCKAYKEIIPVSGYRSLYEQLQLINESLVENGIEFTNKYVAKPNCSEHQTGLAIDVAKYSDNIDFVSPEFPYHGVCQEFRNNAAAYGFIERYPSNKEKITGISPEPWHFRYVGFPHSVIMYNNNFTLEEYTSFLKQYEYCKKSYIYEDTNNKIKIAYLRLKDTTTYINVTNKPWLISGNNIDGIIYTQWV